MLCKSLNQILGTNNVLADNQENFSRKRNTFRLLYRLHLNLEHSRITKPPTALLNIDHENVYDNAGIDVLVYKVRPYQVNGKIFAIIRTYLKDREAIIKLSDLIFH